MEIPLRNTSDRYGLIAGVFHWVVAVLIFQLLLMGYNMGAIPMGPDKIWVINLHKSLGITVFALGIMRLIWRFYAPAPESLPTHAPWERILAKTIHAVFYVCMIGMPLSGWAMSSAGEFPVSFFGLFFLPAIVPKDHDLHEALEGVHEFLALGLMVCIALHIAGALKHHLLDHDSTLRRMGANLFLAMLGLALFGAAAFSLFAAEFGTPEELSNPEEERHVHESHDVSPGHEGWVIDYPQSAIGIEFTQYGQSVKAAFERWDGQIVFDKDNLSASHAQIVIEAASLNTGSTDRDQSARGAEWFDTNRFPNIVFKSESFRDLGSSSYEAIGTLTVRDVTMPLRFPFTLDFKTSGQGQKDVEMKAALSLKRLDFGVGQGQWQSTEGIADEILINLEVHAAQQPAP